jgi:hypothetical protein
MVAKRIVDFSTDGAITGNELVPLWDTSTGTTKVVSTSSLAQYAKTPEVTTVYVDQTGTVAGDGTTPDKAAIDAIIATAPAIGSGTLLRVIFGPKRYLVGSLATVHRKAVELLGPRSKITPSSSSTVPYGTMLLASANNDTILTFGDGTNIYQDGPRVEGLILHANAKSGVTGVVCHTMNNAHFRNIAMFEVKVGVQFRRANFAGSDEAWNRFEHVYMYRVGAHATDLAAGGAKGIDLGGALRCAFDHVQVFCRNPSSGRNYGVYCDGDAVDNTMWASASTFVDCDFEATAKGDAVTGVYLRRARHVVFSRCAVEALDIAFDFDGLGTSSSAGRNNGCRDCIVAAVNVGVQFEANAVDSWYENLLVSSTASTDVPTPVKDLSNGLNRCGSIGGSELGTDRNIVINAGVTLAWLHRNRTFNVNPTSGDAAITIPDDTTLNLPIGSFFEAFQSHATNKCAIAASGSTVLRSEGNKLRTSGQWSKIRAEKTGANTWLVTGDRVV